MKLDELGRLLRQVREDKGLTLDEIAARTKIGRHVLQGIEDGAMSALPHRAYAKAFVREYARQLGAEIENLPGILDGIFATGEEERQQFESFAAMHELAEADGCVWRKFMPVVILVLMAGLLGGLYLLYRTFIQAPDPKEPGLSSPMTQQEPAALVDRSVSEDRWPGVTERDDGADTLKSGSQGIFEASDEQAHGLTEEVGPEAVEEFEAVPDGFDNGVRDLIGEPEAHGQRELQIQAIMDCWMRVEVDGKRQDLFLRPGQEATFIFSEAISVKFGNAGGVRVFVNGETYPFEAKSGEVKTLIIGGEGLNATEGA
ncbi:MAG: helix-turn-helix domain-containing protein [Deltaproteobacteria bacterium]|nr:helix-turn-helix domain-containing protein [Deltaproteobacteria bacterium]